MRQPGSFTHTVTLPEIEGDYVAVVEVKYVGRIWEPGAAQVPITLDRSIPSISNARARNGDMTIRDGDFVSLSAIAEAPLGQQYEINVQLTAPDTEPGLEAECVPAVPTISALRLWS